jgi:hypothetical protein
VATEGVKQGRYGFNDGLVFGENIAMGRRWHG